MRRGKGRSRMWKIDRVRRWLICLLAGKQVVVLNCEIKGTVYFQPGQKGIVANCHITDCMEKSKQSELRVEVNAALERIAKKRGVKYV